MNLLGAIRSSFGFFTIIPVNDKEFDKGAINLLWMPYLTASIFAALIYLVLSLFLNFYISAIISFIGISLFLGLQNVDALSDLGDGLMKRGTPDERFKVMKDSTNGSGGMFSLFSVYAISIISLISIVHNQFLSVILFSQINSIIWIVVISFRNKTTESGLANYFFEKISRKTFFISNFFPVILIIIFLMPQFLLIFSISMVISLIFRLYFMKIFKKINGDIMGASGEIGRMFSLILVNIPSLSPVICFHLPLILVHLP
ncbi:adenosylcobinamide-GDP ribazoletransferase [Cuniculiplasma sp. SKW4]|uniref:adenosylcobinamide-GDP ribazoletransferase n=1 Tax=Cuniculiplasma sp. SKW4 TaxID=3400171 RepID=UPI003FD0ACAE